MSWLFSRALVAEYSADTSLVGELSAPSSGNPTQLAFLSHGKTTAFSRLSRFGMTFAPLTEDRGEALLMSYLADFHAKTSARQETVPVSTASDQVFGVKWHESLVKYDPDSCSWRTHRSLWDEALPWSSVILPRWGMTLNGVVYQHPTLERPINVTASGLWQTPVADDAAERKAGKWNSRGEPKLSAQVILWPTPRAMDHKGSPRQEAAAKVRARGHTPNLQEAIAENQSGGQLNPTWVEWLMGWPLGWTDLKPLAMDRFREWQQQHSPCFLDDREAA